VPWLGLRKACIYNFQKIIMMIHCYVGTFLLLLIPLTIFYERAQSFFRKTNTTVARLESISRSPIYADFSQALTGL